MMMTTRGVIHLRGFPVLYPRAVLKSQAVKQRVKILSTPNARTATPLPRCEFDKRGLFLHEVYSNLKMKM